MFKNTITYKDYNDVERTEDFYFNLTEAELMEMEMGTTGGYAESVKKIIAAKDVPTIMKIFKELLLKAYGEKSADGKRFIKNDQLREEFSQTEAYSKMFMELATDAEKGAEFINKIMPSDLRVKLDEARKNGELPELAEVLPTAEEAKTEESK